VVFDEAMWKQGEGDTALEKEEEGKVLIVIRANVLTQYAFRDSTLTK
jgi:hypothetical protein